MNLRLSQQPHDAEAMIRCVRAAGAAQDRMHYVPVEPSVRFTRSEPARQAPVNSPLGSLTPHECALYRALSARFPPDQCVQMVLRARRGEGA